eukprot:tig00021494_g21922.t1
MRPVRPLGREGLPRIGPQPWSIRQLPKNAEELRRQLQEEKVKEILSKNIAYDRALRGSVSAPDTHAALPDIVPRAPFRPALPKIVRSTPPDEQRSARRDSARAAKKSARGPQGGWPEDLLPPEPPPPPPEEEGGPIGDLRSLLARERALLEAVSRAPPEEPQILVVELPPRTADEEAHAAARPGGPGGPGPGREEGEQADYYGGDGFEEAPPEPPEPPRRRRLRRPPRSTRGRRGPRPAPPPPSPTPRRSRPALAPSPSPRGRARSARRRHRYDALEAEAEAEQQEGEGDEEGAPGPPPSDPEPEAEARGGAEAPLSLPGDPQPAPEPPGLPGPEPAPASRPEPEEPPAPPPPPPPPRFPKEEEARGVEEPELAWVCPKYQRPPDLEPGDVDGLLEADPLGPFRDSLRLAPTALKTDPAPEAPRPAPDPAPAPVPVLGLTAGLAGARGQELEGYAVYFKVPQRWHPPQVEMASLLAAAFSCPVPHPWRELATADGRVYYHDRLANQTSWTHPLDPVYKAYAETLVEFLDVRKAAYEEMLRVNEDALRRTKRSTRALLALEMRARSLRSLAA